MTEQDLHDYNKWLTEVWSKQHSNIPFMKDAPKAYLKYKTKQCDITAVVSIKNKPKRTLGDFDVWYKPCTRCGFDTAKSTKPKDGNKTCWKCGNFVQRDYTDRALKK